jgi:hypothetical protein
LSLAVPDVFVGEEFAGEVVVVEDFDEDSSEDDEDPDPLQACEVMSEPGNVNADSKDLPSACNKGIDMLPEDGDEFIGKHHPQRYQKSIDGQID